MKHHTQQLLISLVVIVLMMTACAKEETPSAIPNTPTTLSPADGTMLTDLSVTLQAGGSLAENGENVSYHFYYGTDTTDMEEAESASIKNLTAGAKYFWKAVPYTKDNNSTEYQGEATAIRSFYTTPSPLSGLVSDNGETETAVILKWTKPANCKQVKITFTPACADVQQPIILPGDQDSCILTKLLDFKTVDKSYVKYTFSVEATVTVGDKDVNLNALTIDEIPLNKKYNVRDVDFNVYTLVTIGNQVWFKENLKATKFNNGASLIKGKHYLIGTQSDSYGFYYAPYSIYANYINHKPGTDYLAPKGFHVAQWADWTALFKHMGVTEDLRGAYVDYSNIYAWRILGEGKDLGYYLKSNQGWQVVNATNGNGNDYYHLSILPSGYINAENKEEIEVGQAAYQWAIYYDDGSYCSTMLRFTAADKNIYTSLIVGYFPVRCVKDAE